MSNWPDSSNALREFNRRFRVTTQNLIRLPGETDAQLRQRAKMANFGAMYGADVKFTLPKVFIYWCHGCHCDRHFLETDVGRFCPQKGCALPIEPWDEAQVVYDLTGDWGAVSEMSEARRTGGL